MNCHTKKKVDSPALLKFFKRAPAKKFAVGFKPIKKKPKQMLLRYTFNNSLIGYGGLVHLNWTDLKGEVSFLLDSNRTKDTKQYSIECKTFLKLIKKCAFEQLGLNKISTYAYSHRKNHVQTIESAGFTREGVLRQDTIVDGNWVDAILASCLHSEFDKPENFPK